MVPVDVTWNVIPANATCRPNVTLARDECRANVTPAPIYVRSIVTLVARNVTLTPGRGASTQT